MLFSNKSQKRLTYTRPEVFRAWIFHEVSHHRDWENYCVTRVITEDGQYYDRITSSKPSNSAIEYSKTKWRIKGKIPEGFSEYKAFLIANGWTIFTPTRDSRTQSTLKLSISQDFSDKLIGEAIARQERIAALAKTSKVLQREQVYNKRMLLKFEKELAELSDLPSFNSEYWNQPRAVLQEKEEFRIKRLQEVRYKIEFYKGLVSPS